MRTLKDSGLSWFPRIPEDWNINRLKVLFRFGKGLGITKENLIEEGVPVISYGQVHSKDNTGTEHNPSLEKFVSEDYLYTSSDCLVNKGDFIFADTSEDLEGCGNCAYISEQKKMFAGYHTIILSNQYSNDNKYLAYLFKTDIWRSQIRKKVNCVKVYSVTKSILNGITVVVPPLKEQQLIVSYLDTRCSKIDGAIAQRKAIIDKLKEYKSAVIIEAVTKGLNSDAEMKDSGIEWIGSVPKHWEVTRLKFVAYTGSGTTPNSKTNEYYEKGTFNWIQSGDLYNNVFIDCVSKQITEKAIQECNLKYYFAPFIVVAMYGASIGNVSISRIDSCTNQACCVVLPKNKNNIKFLYYVISLAKVKLLVDSIGGTQPNISQEKIRNINIPLPLIKEQENIADYLDSQCTKIDEAVARQEQAIAKLEEYRESLIYHAVTGKIDCRNV